MARRKLEEFRPQAVNANRHTVRGLALLDDAMSRDGFVAPITVAADGEAIDGSARIERAVERFPGVEPIVVEHDGTRPIVMVRTDIASADTPQARRIAVAANRIAQVDLDWDASVLEGLAVEMDLSGLGFDADELAVLSGAGEIVDPENQWKGMPECENEDQTSWKSIRVHFASAADLEAFGKIVGQVVGESTRSIWYPAAEIGRYADKRYSDEA